MVVFTSRALANCDRNASRMAQPVGLIRRLAVVTCILVYLQIVLGAVLRHVPVDAEPATFVLAVRFHLFLAARADAARRAARRGSCCDAVARSGRLPAWRARCAGLIVAAARCSAPAPGS